MGFKISGPRGPAPKHRTGPAGLCLACEALPRASCWSFLPQTFVLAGKSLGLAPDPSLSGCSQDRVVGRPGGESQESLHTQHVYVALCVFMFVWAYYGYMFVCSHA